MHIVIDMQGAQTESRFRGIGRYAMGFARAVVRNRGEHEITLALSGLFPETIETIRAAFDGLILQENIRVWHAPGPVKEEEPGNDNRRETAELLREAFLASLQPDVIHICSLFEGYVDDAVTSIGCFDTDTPVSVTLHDLIPLLNPDRYLKPNPRYEQHYLRKIESLKRAALHLAISESSRQEGIRGLQCAPETVVNTLEASEPHCQPQAIDEATVVQLKQKFGICRPFVLYTGGADERKNLPRLIEAYAALPTNLRDHYQLVFAGKMPEGNVENFQKIARAAGLKAGELLFTGYVSDEELIQLYNLCKLYVFPSWHEGFGLPALEAMACGALVIGANTSSLPEVIGMDEALFDPFDVTAITQKMANALEDEDLRNRLRVHGLQQAKKFSWDETATRAIHAWEGLLHRSMNTSYYSAKSHAYNRLTAGVARCIKNPPEPHLIALSDCMALNESAGIERQLLLDISELCQRDAATGVQRVVRSYLKRLLQSPPAGFRIEPVYATREKGYRYARRFTLRFLGQENVQASDDPIRWQRGDIFFGLDMQHHVQLERAIFFRQLRQEGVVVKFLVHDLLPIQMADLVKEIDAKVLHEQWLTMIAATDSAICVSKVTAEAFDNWAEEHAIPRAPTFRLTWVYNGGDMDSFQPSSGVPDDAAAILETLRQRLTFLCVSTIEPRKRQQQILEAVEHLWQQGLDINLVFVGQQGWKIEAFAQHLRTHPELRLRLFWFEGISDEYLEKVYAASTCLIAASLNEGFGLSLIEAARYGIPIVARDIPVFREVAGDHAYYFRGDSALDLAEALRAWLDLYRSQQHPQSKGMPWLTWQQSTEKLKFALVEQNYPRRQLLVDISELVQRDAKTGIQRVVCSILKEWLANPPQGYRIEPVYATVDQPYRYARRFTSTFLGIPEEILRDEQIEYAPGDVFLGLDLQPQVVHAQRAFYQALRRQGVQVKFVVYDLLCVSTPQYFVPGAADGFTRWLEVVAENDGAVCISQSVATELSDWVNENASVRKRSFKIGWFHLGADVDNSPSSKSLPPEAETVLEQIGNRPSFLMVGTLEPRKGHAQVLNAFDQLWQSGIDANIVIVGKQGWIVEPLVERLRAHPKRNERLFWLEGISDEYLEKVYAASTCLIAASYVEGFGLPLIEAAQHKLPIIARDIPVFREVAGEHAFYFSGQDSTELAKAIKNWLAMYKRGAQAKSDNMPWLIWKESAEQLMREIIEDTGENYTFAAHSGKRNAAQD